MVHEQCLHLRDGIDIVDDVVAERRHKKMAVSRIGHQPSRGRHSGDNYLVEGAVAVDLENVATGLLCHKVIAAYVREAVRVGLSVILSDWRSPRSDRLYRWERCGCYRGRR